MPHLLFVSFPLAALRVYNCNLVHICNNHCPLTSCGRFRPSSRHCLRPASGRQDCAGTGAPYLFQSLFRHLCLYLCLCPPLFFCHQPLYELSTKGAPLSRHRPDQLCRRDLPSDVPTPHTQNTFFGAGRVGHGLAGWVGRDVLDVSEFACLILFFSFLEVGMS